MIFPENHKLIGWVDMSYVTDLMTWKPLAIEPMKVLTLWAVVKMPNEASMQASGVDILLERKNFCMGCAPFPFMIMMWCSGVSAKRKETINNY